jgi:hypothetical protein
MSHQLLRSRFWRTAAQGLRHSHCWAQRLRLAVPCIFKRSRAAGLPESEP